MKIAENRNFQKRKRSARAGGKKAKHFLGHGPEAPRFTRAVRARARARARAKYRRNFNVINDCFTQWNCKFLKSSCLGAAKKATPIVDMSDAQFQSELKEWTSFILSCWKQASPMSTISRHEWRPISVRIERMNEFHFILLKTGLTDVHYGGRFFGRTKIDQNMMI